MRILVIADIESKALWDYFDKSMLENVDLIVSCGDLNPKYLSFLATFTKAPVIYVRGNHDAKYEMTPLLRAVKKDDAKMLKPASKKLKEKILKACDVIARSSTS